jgi:hypothetical protein
MKSCTKDVALASTVPGLASPAHPCPYTLQPSIRILKRKNLRNKAMRVSKANQIQHDKRSREGCVRTHLAPNAASAKKHANRGLLNLHRDTATEACQHRVSVERVMSLARYRCTINY